MNWNNELQAATSHEAVIAVLNEFLGELAPTFWAQVPTAVQVVVGKPQATGSAPSASEPAASSPSK